MVCPMRIAVGAVKLARRSGVRPGWFSWSIKELRVAASTPERRGGGCVSRGFAADCSAGDPTTRQAAQHESSATSRVNDCAVSLMASPMVR